MAKPIPLLSINFIDGIVTEILDFFFFFFLLWGNILVCYLLINQVSSVIQFEIQMKNIKT
jgi:hypothetical protein